MKNITMIPMTGISVWQLSLTALECATSTLATVQVPSVVVRPIAPNAAAMAPFAADVVADVVAVKRERAFTGKGHRGLTSAYVLGSPAWSHPN